MDLLVIPDDDLLLDNALVDMICQDIDMV